MKEKQERKIIGEGITAFAKHLEKAERSRNTVEKYVRDVTAFRAWCGEREITKEVVIGYKEYLTEKGYKVRSINSLPASLNSYFVFMGWEDCRVKTLRCQREVYCEERKELTRQEYERLCKTAMRTGKERLALILQTVCGTGIRISELQFITAEAVRKGEATVSLKGKTRTVLLVKDLQKKLRRYMLKNGIRSGAIFVSKNGRPLNRSNIWREMKSLCAEARVDPAKVFPHNLRHLFARISYALDKDIAKLADILGHSSIETTRIYIITTVQEHRKRLECMRLIL